MRAFPNDRFWAFPAPRTKDRSGVTLRRSTFRKDSGNRTYIITVSWMISGDVLK